MTFHHKIPNKMTEQKTEIIDHQLKFITHTTEMILSDSERIKFLLAEYQELINNYAELALPFQMKKVFHQS